MPEPTSNSLIGGSLLARNTVFNFLGQVAPLLVALFAIPLLINGLGVDRFGVLTLTWVVIGYSSLFDFGLGRALTKLVAEKLGTQQEQEIPALVWTGLFLMGLLGIAGMIVIGLLSPWLVRDVLEVPIALQPETLHAFYLLALAVPVVIHTTGLRGVLEAKQRFALLSIVRMSMGVFMFLGPLLVLPFSQSLFPIVGVLVAGRVVAWLAHLLLCFLVVPRLREEASLQRVMVKPLLGFGSWMTVSNIVSPLMTHMERFVVGAMVSVTVVAYYTTPHEVVTKLLLIPVAIEGVLFPAFATSFVQDRARTMLLFSQGVKYIFLALFPLTLLIVTLGHEALGLWLGEEFAQNSTRVLQWLAIGVLLHSLSLIPRALVNSIGHPDLVAKLYLVELPFYILALWWMLQAHGIEGVAVTWMVRSAVDVALLFGMVQLLLPTSGSIIRRMALTVGVALLALALAISLVGVVIKGLFLLLALLVFTVAAWFLILLPKERTLVQHHLKTVWSSTSLFAYEIYRKWRSLRH